LKVLGCNALGQTAQSFCGVVGICKIYEEYLRQMNPHTPSITYDISELFKFVDNIYDMSCLV